MTMVIAGDLPEEIAQWRERRARLGQDRRDEVWEGVYHVAPGPTGAHGHVDSELVGVLRPLVQRAGMYAVTATNIGVPDDFRVPDGMVFRERSSSAYAATAAIVLEVLSPGDETFAKFGFYAAHGVEEVIVADPDGRTVRIWQLRDGAYAETGRSDLLGTAASALTDDIDWP